MDAPRILIVEDEAAIAEISRRYLERERFRVDIVIDGESALKSLARNAFDLVLLDISLPGPIDGIEVCRRLRALNNWTPIIFVTARDDEVDRIIGLELGADDYITKPFSPREMVARARAVLRRVDRRQEPQEDVVHVIGSVRLDVNNRRVWVGGSEVSLTATEFELLAELMSKPGRVFARSELLASVWDFPAGDNSRTVDVHIAQIRSKLGAASPVRTVRGYGYSAETAP